MTTDQNLTCPKHGHPWSGAGLCPTVDCYETKAGNASPTIITNELYTDALGRLADATKAYRTAAEGCIKEGNDVITSLDAGQRPFGHSAQRLMELPVAAKVYDLALADAVRIAHHTGADKDLIQKVVLDPSSVWAIIRGLLD